MFEWIRNTLLQSSHFKDHFVSLNTLFLDESVDLKVQHINLVGRIYSWG